MQNNTNQNIQHNKGNTHLSMEYERISCVAQLVKWNVTDTTSLVSTVTPFTGCPKVRYKEAVRCT